MEITRNPSQPRSAESLTQALDGKWTETQGAARCPAHEDNDPSLSISENTKDGNLSEYAAVYAEMGSIPIPDSSCLPVKICRTCPSKLADHSGQQGGQRHV